MKESLKQVLKINSDPLAILINTSFEQEDLSKPSVIAVRLKLIVAIYSYLRIFRLYNLAVGIFFLPITRISSYLPSTSSPVHEVSVIREVPLKIL